MSIQSAVRYITGLSIFHKNEPPQSPAISQPSHFDKLSDWDVQQIFSHLSFKERGVAARACKRFSNVSRSAHMIHINAILSDPGIKEVLELCGIDCSPVTEATAAQFLASLKKLVQHLLKKYPTFYSDEDGRSKYFLEQVMSDLPTMHEFLETTEIQTLKACFYCPDQPYGDLSLCTTKKAIIQKIKENASQIFFVDSGPIPYLPREIKYCTSLDVLKLHRCRLLSQEVWQLKSLRLLELSCMKIKEISPEILDFPYLRDLDIPNTRLENKNVVEELKKKRIRVFQGKYCDHIECWGKNVPLLREEADREFRASFWDKSLEKLTKVMAVLISIYLIFLVCVLAYYILFPQGRV